MAITRPTLKGSRSCSRCPRCARACARGRVSVWAFSGAVALQSRRPHRRAAPAAPRCWPFGRSASPHSLLRRSLAGSPALRAPAPCGETPRIRTCRSRPARRSPAGEGFAGNSGASATRSRRPWRGLRWPRAALLDTWVAPGSGLSSDCPRPWWASQAKEELKPASASGSRGARSGKGPLAMFSGANGWRVTGHLDQHTQPEAPEPPSSALKAEMGGGRS